MDFKNKKNLVIIGAVIILLVIVLWLVIGRGGGEINQILIEVSSDPVELIIGRDMLVALDKMRNVKLDTGFLSNSVYQSLSDFKVEIPSQPIGRRDPFAPI